MIDFTIGLSLSATWLRGQAWRQADSRVEELFSAAPLIDAARLAEQAQLDFLFRPDALTLQPHSAEQSPGFSALDPLTVTTVLATVTRTIGLVPTLSAAFSDPYTVARQLQSIDQLSSGRVGWNVVASTADTANFRRSASGAHHASSSYADTARFIAQVEAFRQSFPAEALLQDRERGRFADVAKLGASLSGEFKQARPITVPAVSADPLPMIVPGGSPDSLRFAAQHADAVFTMTPDISAAKALRDQLKTASGHTSRRVRMLPGLALCLDDTLAQAERRAELSGITGQQRHWTITGTARDAIEGILSWYEAGACDGFITLPLGSWHSLEIFATEVVPALVKQGVFSPKPSPLSGRWQLQEQKERI